MRQAVSGKAARAEFVGLLLIGARNEAATGPRLNVKADPGSAGINLFPVSNFITSDKRDIIGDCQTRANFVTGGEINAFVFAADGQFGLCIKFKLIVEQLLGRAELRDC